MEGEEDDIFLDAVEDVEENFNNPTQTTRIETIKQGEPITLRQGLEEGQLAIDKFFSNDYEAAKDITYRYREVSIYHALGYGTFNFLKAVMTYEQDHVDTASKILSQSVNTIQQFRKKGGFGDSLGKMVKRKDYNEMTELEVHAELVYAECLLLKAMLTIVEDENLVSFVKAGMKVRQAYVSFKECWSILHKRDWSKDEHKEHFEGGVRLGVGTFNLLMSLLPAKVTKLMEFVGFSGSKEVGMKELLACYRSKRCLRQVLSSLILLVYHLILTTNMGKQADCDKSLVEEILQEKLSKYPTGTFFLFFKGRYDMIRGRCEEASVWYKRANNSQVSWVQFHHINCWEMLWSAVFRAEWREALIHADRLLIESKWSPCIYAYFKAALYCQLPQLTTAEKEELDELMERVPELKQRIGGKSIPMEKYAIKKAEKFKSQNGRLLVPGLEMLYLWHGFSIIGQQYHMVEKVHLLVQEAQEQIKDKSVEDDCLLDLLRGMCLKHMGFPLQAEDAFKAVLGRSAQITVDKFLIPYTTVELAILLLDQGELNESSNLLNKAKSYTSYSLQNRLHFKIHATQSRIKTLQTQEVSSKVPDSRTDRSSTPCMPPLKEFSLSESSLRDKPVLSSRDNLTSSLSDYREVNPII